MRLVHCMITWEIWMLHAQRKLMKQVQCITGIDSRTFCRFCGFFTKTFIFWKDIKNIFSFFFKVNVDVNVIIYCDKGSFSAVLSSLTQLTHRCTCWLPFWDYSVFCQKSKVSSGFGVQTTNFNLFKSKAKPSVRSWYEGIFFNCVPISLRRGSVLIVLGSRV